ncbi:MAG: hypothetical protein IIB62_05520 [Proteobacteria bacterium]|nr:hypothetical protein [Pseudomonadota bacterium]
MSQRTRTNMVWGVVGQDCHLDPGNIVDCKSEAERVAKEWNESGEFSKSILPFVVIPLTGKVVKRGKRP